MEIRIFMIRVPFFPSSSLATEKAGFRRDSVSADALACDEDGLARLEARLSSLKVGLREHAEELKKQVSDRVLKIHSRLENALHPFQPESETDVAIDGAKNVLSFESPRHRLSPEQRNLLHLRNAREAMKELNETLRATREHLEALDSSVEKMRRRIDSHRK